jgi:ABC-type glutathione transport system ATPase component
MRPAFGRIAVVTGLCPNGGVAALVRSREMARTVQNAFEQPSASLQVRMTIAGIIEERLGPDQRADYLYQAFLGNA